MSGARRARAAALATMALVVTACTGSGGGGNPSDRIKIGIAVDQPGLGFKDGDRFTGFDVNVAMYVAQQLGFPADKIDWIEAPPGQREVLISTGQVTLVVAAYSITTTRQEKVSFAGPYFVAGQDLLVRSDDTHITGPGALTGKRVCTVTGSTSATKVKEAVPGVNLQEFRTNSECVAALASGTIDAVTTDDTILAGYAAQPQYKGKLKVVGTLFSEEQYGIGLKKGDTSLCNKVTEAIRSMISDGSWQQLVDNNLGPAGFKPGAGNPPKPRPCT